MLGSQSRPEIQRCGLRVSRGVPPAAWRRRAEALSFSVVGFGAALQGVVGLPRMSRRERLLPILVLAIFAVAACAVSMAHGQSDEPRSCTATKAESKPALATPADLAVPLVSTVHLAERPAAIGAAVPEFSPGIAREARPGLHVPRPPPA